MEETGGSHGVRDTNLLLSAAGRPGSGHRGAEFFPSIFLKAAALLEAIIRNHPFVDGNKRTGVAAAGVFLDYNGYSLSAGQEELVEFAVSIATEHPSVEDIAEWLEVNSSRVKSKSPAARRAP